MESILKQDDIIYSVVEEAEISQELDASIREALMTCFPADKEVFSKYSWWHSKPSYRILAYSVTNKLIGHVAVVERNIGVEAQQHTIRVAGIQSVFVLPSQRGKGVSDRLLTIAMTEARRCKLDSGILFCVSELEKVYAKTGWHKIDTQVYMLDANNKEVSVPSKNILMIYPISNVNFPSGNIHLNGLDW